VYGRGVYSLAPPLTLLDGSLVEAGEDAEGIWVAHVRPGGARSVVRLPAWEGGVGGLELVASPDQRHLALFVYSGQSTQGYELLTLVPDLARVGGLPETFGHGDAPAFSPDGRWLVMFIDAVDARLPRHPDRVRGTDLRFEEVAADAEDDQAIVVDWACLYVATIPPTEVQAVPVGVELAAPTELELREWNTYGAVSFCGPDALILRMPWGEALVLNLPPQGPITSRGYRAGRSTPGSS
jgi:hypothetical protein